MFDLDDVEKIRQSFNIFIDLELNELSQIVSVAALKPNQKKSTSTSLRNLTSQHNRNRTVSNSPNVKNPRAIHFSSPQHMINR